MKKRVPHDENRLVLWCKRMYKPLLEWSLRRRKLVVGGAVLALVLSLVGATRVGTEFLPELNEGSIWINVPLHPSVSVTEARN
jgi:cobalt-zinc-cadmium resistance protein CzcA